MNTRLQSKKGGEELVEEDPEIGSRSWLRKQREIAMANEGGSNVEKQLADLTTMFHKMTLQFQSFQEQQSKKSEGETSEGKRMNVENTNSIFQSTPLKLEVKFDLPTFDGEVNAEKLDNWLKQLEVYCRVQKIVRDEDKIQLATLKMSGNALIWWECCMQNNENESLNVCFASWSHFIQLLRDQFYPLGYRQKVVMDWQNLRQNKGQSVQEYTTEFRKKATMLGISLNSQETLLKYIGGLNNYLKHTLLMFDPTDLDKVCVQATHLEERGKFLKESKKKNASNSNSEKNKGKEKKKTTSTAQKEKSKDVCNHCKKEGHLEVKCWKLHPELRPKPKGQKKQANTMAKEIDGGSEVDEKMACMDLHSSNNEDEEKKKIELFHIKVQVKQTRIDTLFDSGSQANLIAEEYVKTLALTTIPHPHPYPLGWVHKNSKLEITKQCKVKFGINRDYIDEVLLDVVPLDICGIVLGSPYLWDRDALFYRKENKYRLIKDGIEYIVNSHQSTKRNISLITAGQAKRLINAGQMFALAMVRSQNEVEIVKALDECIPQHKYEVKKVISEFEDLFQIPNELPPKRDIQHEIQLLPDVALPNIGLYRHSFMENEEIKRQVKELLEQGVIRPSTSPCGSPIVIIPKKDGTWRMCVDYRALNKITVKNRYPLPRIDDLMDQLHKAKYFTKLDLRSGYHQVRVKEEDVWKTAFKTRQGLFEWLVLPFGLCNAPATFMRVMNEVLRSYIDEFVIVYLDDILIYSDDWESHKMHIRKVFEVLRKAKLYLKMSKCEFVRKSLIYLGHIVGEGQLKIDPAKVEAVMNWPPPTNVTETRSFLGAVQYLRKFIANFSFMASPLHALTGKSHGFQWGGKEQHAFDLLKKKISNAPVLALPNLQKCFEIETDASDYAMGAVLLQDRHPVCYHSEMFNNAVRNYPTYDKELFALVQSVKKWKHYLVGKETIIHTDHQPLQYLQSQSKLQQSRHFRWMGFLQQFHLVIRYKKGTQNKIADMLSRPPIVATVVILQNSSLMHEGYKEQYEVDPDFQNIYGKLILGNEVGNNDFHVNDGLLFHLGKLCIPIGERNDLIREAHTSRISGHFGVGKTLANLQRYCY